MAQVFSKADAVVIIVSLWLKSAENPQQNSSLWL